MDHYFDEVTQGINDDMALAPFDFLAGIVADFAAHFGGLGTLTIDNRCTCFGFPALPLAFFVP